MTASALVGYPRTFAIVHAPQIEGVGWHGWTEPTREQIAERLRKRLKPRTTTKETMK